MGIFEPGKQKTAVTEAFDGSVPLRQSAADEAEEWRAAYLHQMRHVPGPVAIVAAASGNDRGGLTATAWSSLCADPPTLLACINRKTRAYPIILEAKFFSINLLSAIQVEEAAVFSGQRGLAGAQRFLAGDWVEGTLGQPILKGAVATFECSLEHAHDHDTHSILIGRVGAMTQRADGVALLYRDGSFGSYEPAVPPPCS